MRFFSLTSSFRAARIGGVLAVIMAVASPAQSAGVRIHHGGPACSTLGTFVFIGGTAGFNTLADDKIDDTKAVRETGYVGLYQHGTAIAAAISPKNVLKSIVRTFAHTGPGQAELGWVGADYFTDNAEQFPSYYQAQFILNGLRPSEANVDTPDQFDMKAWRKYVDSARSVGILTVAPIVAPNVPKEPRTDFSTNPFYKDARQAALYGGAIAFDTPPVFYLEGGSGAGYQTFIKEAIRWANLHKLRTTVLLSPYLSPQTFLQDTQKFIAELAKDPLTIPTEWSVDDYANTDPNANPYTDRNAGYYMGPDTLLNTTAQIGLWVVRNAPVSVHPIEPDENASSVVARSDYAAGYDGRSSDFDITICHPGERPPVRP
jgi:hypothetical protein